MHPPPRQSFFLFGPRGVGKTAWLHQQFPDALFFDMLDHHVYTELLAGPQRLGDRIPQGHKDWGGRGRSPAGAGIAQRGASPHRVAEVAVRADGFERTQACVAGG